MAPALAYCEEKKRLMDAYLAASHEVLTLQDQETTEILKGGDMDRFDLALEAARIKGTPQRLRA